MEEEKEQGTEKGQDDNKPIDVEYEALETNLKSLDNRLSNAKLYAGIAIIIILLLLALAVKWFLP